MRAAAELHWAGLSAANPHLWDGRILGVTAQQGELPLSIVDGVLTAEAREEAFSVFLHWRDSGFPEIGIRNVFGSALIASNDGAFIYGLMGGVTANAGRVYPPGGSLEPTDVDAEGRVGVLASIGRELAEETGLTAGEAELGRLLVTFDGPRISVARVFRFDQPAGELAARIRGNLELQDYRELADVIVVRSAADAAAAGEVPPYAAALADQAQVYL
jgi:8-oxo-dGTP pyrophosphatase MutT (NUDIX family)